LATSARSIDVPASIFKHDSARIGGLGIPEIGASKVPGDFDDAEDFDGAALNP